MTLLPSRPIDATLSVTKAARLLGVHPNTVRAWSDAGRLRYYRINPRGDRRYRMSDLHRFLSASDASVPMDGVEDRPAGRRRGPSASTEDSLPLVEHQSMMALVGQLSEINASAIRE